MNVNWGSVVAIFLAIVLASLVEHMVIAPRMAHSPPNTAAIILGNTVDGFVKAKWPTATTV